MSNKEHLQSESKSSNSESTSFSKILTVKDALYELSLSHWSTCSLGGLLVLEIVERHDVFLTVGQAGWIIGTEFYVFIRRGCWGLKFMNLF